MKKNYISSLYTYTSHIDKYYSEIGLSLTLTQKGIENMKDL